MDKRIALKKGTSLNFTSKETSMRFFIESEFGRGASCIAYNAYFFDNLNQKNEVIIKECFPFGLHIKRCKDNTLFVEKKDAEKFDTEKALFLHTYEVKHGLYDSVKTNSIESSLNIFLQNNTIYLVSEKIFGSSLAECMDLSLSDKIKLVLSTAKTIWKIHDAGFLYLDIKPQNVMTFSETYEIIELFDFDSLIPIDDVENSDEYRLSYTKGFAAPEMISGDRRKISLEADFYGIGALLYFLIFHETPSAVASEKDAKYDFEKIKEQETNYNQKLYRRLTDFFHKTISNFINDRYHDDEALISELSELVRFSAPDKLFLNSFGIIRDEALFGRESELKELCYVLEKENTVFLCGPSFSGRSAIVRHYIKENRAKYDNVIIVNFMDSFKSLINDDRIFSVNGIKRTINDSDDDYFSEKIRLISKICREEKDLLVVCNYDRDDPDFGRVINAFNHVILTTDEVNLANGFEKIEVGGLSDDAAFETFEYYLGRNLDDFEAEHADIIINEVHGHPFAIELIAKGIRANNMSLKSALYIMENEGFSNLAFEKVSAQNHGSLERDSIRNLLGRFVDFSWLDDDTHFVLKFASIYENTGININDVMEDFKIKTRDPFNILLEKKWAIISNARFVLEPFYLEAARGLAFDPHEIDKIKDLFRLLYDLIKSEDDALILISYLEFSRKLINSFSNDNSFCRSESFLRLLDITLIKIPKENDRFIIEKGLWRIRSTRLSYPYQDAKIFDKIIDAYLCKNDVDNAFRVLDLLKSYLKHQRENWLMGAYFESRSSIFDYLMNGEYSENSRYEKDFNESIDNAIKCFGASRNPKSQISYARLLTGKTVGMIRSGKYDNKKLLLKGMLDKAEGISKRFASNNSLEHLGCLMAWGWYDTYIVPDIDKLSETLSKASEIASKLYFGRLIYLDEFLIPAANMYAEVFDFDAAKNILHEAMDYCKNLIQSDSVIIMEYNILHYFLDVENDEGERKKIEKGIEEFEKENAEVLNIKFNK